MGWGDGLPCSFGHGRAASLGEQALGPLLAPDEMANDDLVSVVSRLRATETYSAEMATVFGSPEVKISRIATAIAAFQRTLDRPTRFDRFLRGTKDILSDEAIWGLHLFRTKARCANCHMGPNLTDGKFHNLGLSYYSRKLEDLGRYSVTGDPADVGKFKTPSLRHLARTGPYMHNGVFPSLRGLVSLYAIGGGRSARELDKDDPLFPHASALLHKSA
ncbi:MAG: cytochrome-c peroxidase, partial [Pelagimonas sp.]